MDLEYINTSDLINTSFNYIAESNTNRDEFQPNEIGIVSRKNLSSILCDKI